jgi:hypothetical protein
MSAEAVAGVPDRPVLRPGLCVVRRDDRHLQVGLDPPHRVVVPDAPEVRRLLEELRLGVRPTPGTPVAHRVLAALMERDLLVDAAELDARLATAADRPAVAAVFGAHGSRAPGVLDRRAAAAVALDVPADLADAAARLLHGSGLRTPAGATPVVLLVIGDSVVARDRLDQAVRAGVPHLLVQGGPSGVTIGPFVVPGITACVRCVDAHRAEADPRRSMLIEQCGRDSPILEPRDPALMALAVAWAVRDLVSFVDGDEPATWSATVSVGAGPEPVRSRFARHPHCGCSWGASLAG